jgi:acyl carrier protein
MNLQEINIEVKELIADTLGIGLDTIQEESRLADLTNDSIQLFELLLAFERKYNTETTYEDIVQLNSVGDIVRYVNRMQAS